MKPFDTEANTRNENFVNFSSDNALISNTMEAEHGNSKKNLMNLINFSENSKAKKNYISSSALTNDFECINVYKCIQ